MPVPRVLLVELLSLDRFSQFRSGLYPFLQGFAASRGLPVRWVCLGFDPNVALDDIRALTLPPDDLAILRQVISEHQATHALLNEQLDPVQEQGLRAAYPSLRLRYGGLTHCRTRIAEVRAWLDQPAGPAADQALIDVTEPDYTCELVNDLSHEVRPLVEVVCGPSCVYSRPASRSRHYADVDLSGLDNACGCAFCGRPRVATRCGFSASPVDLAVSQVEAIARLEPGGRHPREFDIGSVLVWHEVDRFFERLMEARLSPSSFYFTCRIDELLEQAERLERVLPAVHAAGHTLNLASVGVENFSRVENDRLNKNISREQVGEYLATLKRWQREWPDTVHFDRHGGFGFILFTPWTTLDDLRINANALRELEIQNVLFCLLSRLLLIRDRPITRLAERDGLTCNEFEDPLMARFSVAGCLTEWGQREIPWRFVSPEVAVVYRIVLRLEPAAIAGTGDPDAAALAALRLLLPEPQRDPLGFFEALLDLVERHRDVRVAGELFARWENAIASSGDGIWHAVMKAVSEHEKRFGVPPEVERRDDGMWVTLTRERDRLTLFVQRSTAEGPAYLSTPRLAISHAKETPIDTRAKHRMVVQFARMAERFASAPLAREE